MRTSRGRRGRAFRRRRASIYILVGVGSTSPRSTPASNGRDLRRDRLLARVAHAGKMATASGIDQHVRQLLQNPGHFEIVGLLPAAFRRHRALRSRWQPDGVRRGRRKQVEDDVLLRRRRCRRRASSRHCRDRLAESSVFRAGDAVGRDVGTVAYSERSAARRSPASVSLFATGARRRLLAFLGAVFIRVI